MDYTFEVDLSRKINTSKSINIDTNRIIGVKVSNEIDSIRKINKGIIFFDDTRRGLAKYFSDIDINRLSLNLSTGTFTQRPSIEIIRLPIRN